MSHRKIAIAKGIRVCHNARNTILYNPRTFERLEIDPNAGLIVRSLEGGGQTLSHIVDYYAEQNHVEKDHLSVLSASLGDFVDELVEQHFLSWEPEGSPDPQTYRKD